MSDLARLPSYPSPTTLIARSGIQFLDFGLDPTKLRVREWGFHDAATSSSVDDLVQLDFDEGRRASKRRRGDLLHTLRRLSRSSTRADTAQGGAIRETT